MTGPPPRPGPITHTAKPVARSPTDLARDLSYGHGAGLVYVLAAVRVVLIRLPARAGTRPGSTRGQHMQPFPSDRTGTISSTARVRRTSWNAMKSRIHCVLTQWKPGFTASGRRRAADRWCCRSGRVSGGGQVEGF